jgi:hypothetical protein
LLTFLSKGGGAPVCLSPFFDVKMKEKSKNKLPNRATEDIDNTLFACPRFYLYSTFSQNIDNNPFNII